MIIDMAKTKKLVICTGYTDLRKQKNGLISLIEGEFSEKIEPYTLYLFCGKSAKVIKGLIRESDGWLVLRKDMDYVKLRWPRSVRELQSMTPAQLQRLMVGLSIV